MRKILFVLVVFILSAAIAAVYPESLRGAQASVQGEDSRRAAPDAPASSPAADTGAKPSIADEVKPSDEWARQYFELRILLQSIADMEKESGIAALRNRADGISARLQSQIPAEYGFDANKMLFTRKQAAPDPIPAPGRTPAKKKK